MMPSRREIGLGLTCVWLVGAAPDPVGARLAAIERAVGGRLGVAVIDTGSGHHYGYRSGERFAMCSTFKLLAAAAILVRVDQGRARLDHAVAIRRAVILPHSPVTERHVGAMMTLAQLCDAAVTQSDNAAANLLLREIGGPGGVTALARSLGDRSTRLDRWEPALNTALPGDARDTTTPAAMAETMRRLLLGDALSAASRAHLAAWLKGNRTGADRVRRDVPRDWIVGDKTGTGERGSTGDIAILWPPRRSPVLAAVYLTGSDAPLAKREAAIAAVGRVIAARG